jgi:hypothetical protein
LFSFAQNDLSVAAEAALDGIYVVRTNLPAAHSDTPATVRAYKSLSGVEHAFRSLKTVDLVCVLDHGRPLIKTRGSANGCSARGLLGELSGTVHVGMGRGRWCRDAD